MEKRYTFLTALLLLISSSIPMTSLVSASTNDEVPSGLGLSDIDHHTTLNKKIPANSGSGGIQPFEATGQHSTSKLVSTHVTKNKLLKVLTGYQTSESTVSISIGRSFSASVSVSDGDGGTAGLGFSTSITEGHSFKVPKGKKGAVGYYGTVTAKKFLISVYNNMDNSFVTSYYSTVCTLSNKYYGLVVK
ncbi:hypothetical protein [Lapidilactobacillus salsurivasis]